MRKSKRTKIKYTVQTDSDFERRLMEHPDYKDVCTEAGFHQDKIDYIVEHTYTPDWTVVSQSPDGGTDYVYYEAKGFHKDPPSKYLWIRKVLPPNAELRFIFQNGKTFMPNSRRRKDGTRANMVEWATKHGFKFRDCKGKV